MRSRLKIMAVFGLLCHLALPQPVSATAEISNLERLNWLCSDYQMPVKGFVVESWFALPYGIISNEKMKELLGVDPRKEVNMLSDGSTCRISSRCERSRHYIEMQLITNNAKTAITYEQKWKAFAARYHLRQPVGATILAEFPECMDKKAMHELTLEILNSLYGEVVSISPLENGYQAVAYSTQMSDTMIIGQERVNINLAFQQGENSTMLYLGTPVIYQQY